MVNLTLVFAAVAFSAAFGCLSPASVLADGSPDGSSGVGEVPSGPPRPGWPTWPFPPLGPVMEGARRYADLAARDGNLELSRVFWGRLYMMAVSFLGPCDPRAWASMARVGRCLSEMGAPEAAAGALKAALKGLRGSARVLRGISVPDADSAVAREISFAEETLALSNEKMGFRAGGGEGDCFADVSVDAMAAAIDAEGNPDRPGDAAAGGGEADGGPWPDAAGRAAALPGLRGEMERLAARDPGSREALAAGQRYARELAGVKGSGEGLSDPKVPAEDLETALSLSEGLVEALAAKGGQAGAELLEARRLKADALFSSGRAREARELRDANLSAARKSLGPLHLVSLGAMSDLGESLATDDPKAATAMMAEALGGLTRILGSVHRETAIAHMRLGDLLMRAGDPAGGLAARAMATRVLDRAGRRGAVHAVYARAENGVRLMNLGESEAAAGVLERANSDATHFLGDAWPVTLEVRVLMGAAYLEVGFVREAERVLRSVLAVREGPGGPRGPEFDGELARNLGLLASAVMRGGGDPEEAGILFAREQGLWERSAGEGDRAALRALSGMAEAAAAAGDRESALLLHRQALARRVRYLGEDDPETRESAAAVGRFSAGP
ncbi:MAG: tetratricopeptide repeat protein [Deltaproteobacteria bacterium]|nr:tetratricopeptide repeat protein [Deltaproteobacteria bacterium]